MIAYVEQQLGITAAQREAWERFTEIELLALHDAAARDRDRHRRSV